MTRDAYMHVYSCSAQTCRDRSRSSSGGRSRSVATHDVCSPSPLLYAMHLHSCSSILCCSLGQSTVVLTSDCAVVPQDLSIHPEWARESPVDWKQFFTDVQTGSESCSIAFRTGPLKNHCVSSRSLLTLPMPTIMAMIMQYKQLCHDQLGQSQLSQDESSHNQLNHPLHAHQQPQQQLLSHQHTLDAHQHPYSLDQQTHHVEQQDHMQNHYQQTHDDPWCQQQQQQQQQPRPEAASQMDEMLIKEYVAVGMLGSESNPLEPFHRHASNGNVMQADIVWLAKWSQVLVGLCKHPKQHVAICPVFQ